MTRSRDGRGPFCQFLRPLRHRFLHPLAVAVVRLTFEPQGRRPASGDLRDAEGPLMLRAQTTIYRTRVTGVRYETETTGVRSVSRDPIAIRKGHGGLQRVPLRRDEPWSQRLITLIANRIEQPAANAGPDA